MYFLFFKWKSFHALLLKLNICAGLAECGKIENKTATGCEMHGQTPARPVGLETALQVSDGLATLMYKGSMLVESGKATIGARASV